MTAGVYLITNTTDGRVYVGESGDIELRWTFHLQMLADGCHHNRALQAAFNEQGINNFRFSVLVDEIQDRKKRLALERHWTSAKQAWSSTFGYNVDLRSQAMQDWIAKKQRVALQDKISAAEARKATEKMRIAKIYLDQVMEYLEIGELSYEEREELLRTLEYIDATGVLLPSPIRALANKICATKDMKASVRSILFDLGIEYRAIAPASGMSNAMVASAGHNPTNVREEAG